MFKNVIKDSFKQTIDATNATLYVAHVKEQLINVHRATHQKILCNIHSNCLHLHTRCAFLNALQVLTTTKQYLDTAWNAQKLAILALMILSNAQAVYSKRAQLKISS